MHTTSTGDPTQTAIKPAPNPESKCVRILSEKPGIFSKVCRNGDEVKKSINCNNVQNKMQKSTEVFQSFFELTQSDKSTWHFIKSQDQNS